MTIKGTVKEVQWTNPHSFIQVMVPGKDGQTVQWAVEIGSPSINYDMGWKKTSLKAGDQVTMTLAQARNGKPYATLRVATTADGRELLGSAANMGKVIDRATGRPVRLGNFTAEPEAVSTHVTRFAGCAGVLLTAVICTGGVRLEDAERIGRSRRERPGCVAGRVGA